VEGGEGVPAEGEAGIGAGEFGGGEGDGGVGGEGQGGVDGEDLTVRIKLNAIASLHVTVLVQVSHKVILHPLHSYKSSGVVWDFCLKIDGAFKHTTLLGDCVLRERGY
jgi:hypothetical protein